MIEDFKKEKEDELKEAEREQKIKWPIELSKHLFQCVGRRKEASARVRIYKTSKKCEKSYINGLEAERYFALKKNYELAVKPLIVAELKDKYFFTAIVSGGGTTGQAGAISLGLARCLAKTSEEVKKKLAKAGLLRRDPRMVERKKVYHLKARKSPQWHKR